MKSKEKEEKGRVILLEKNRVGVALPVFQVRSSIHPPAGTLFLEYAPAKEKRIVLFFLLTEMKASCSLSLLFRKEKENNNKKKKLISNHRLCWFVSLVLNPKCLR